MSIIAARRNEGRAVWIGMAFSVIATVLVIHGLATPGVILPANGLVQAAGALNLPVCGTILAASGLPILRRPRRAQLLLRIQFLVVVALAVAGATGLVFSRLIPVVPNPSTVSSSSPARSRSCSCLARRPDLSAHEELIPVQPVLEPAPAPVRTLPGPVFGEVAA
jgi:hypothetical protein